VFGVHYDTPENKFDFESENPDNPFNEEDDDDEDDDDGEFFFGTHGCVMICRIFINEFLLLNLCR